MSSNTHHNNSNDENEKDKLPEMVNTISRWILQPKETKKLYIKFFSKNIGSFD